jgi:aspartyl protease family protein
MAMSSGVRQAVGLAVGWGLAVAAAAAGVAGLAEVRATPNAADPAVAAGEEAERRGEAGRPRGRVVELQAGRFGHYRARAEVNGTAVDVLLDSGASVVVLCYDDAERAGLKARAQDYTQRVSTANGQTRVAPVILDRLSIGDITVRHVEAAVGEPGKLTQSLLGMSFLGRLQRVDMRAGVLILQE